jgi:hypothetical protein
MEQQTARQLQGAVELIRDVTQGAASSIGAAQEDIAGVPYRVLQHVPLLAGPAHVIERVQRTITRTAYCSVGVIAGVAATAATRLLPKDA